MKGKICGLLAGCVLLAGCAGMPGTSAAQTATAESAPASVPAATAESAAATGKTLTVVLNGCIAYEVDSAGGSLKTAIAAADLVVYLASEDVPADLGGETAAWQQSLDENSQATLDANWPGVYACAEGICQDLDSQQGLLDDAGVTTDFSAMDLTEVPEQLDVMNAALTGK